MKAVKKSTVTGDEFNLREWMRDQGLKPGRDWQVFRGDYHKEFCEIRLKDGKETGPCWPNAGNFVALADGEKMIPGKDVTHVRYYVEILDPDFTEPAPEPREEDEE